ncbi:MAG: hypothetical protein AB2794_16845, partial [Candidatus Thiodiazotropha endolucinida]
FAQPELINQSVFENIGAGERIRTPDQLITNLLHSYLFSMVYKKMSTTKPIFHPLKINKIEVCRQHNIFQI